MDPSTLLSQLRDVHSPAPISFWPLAPGWWLLIVVFIIVLSVSIYLCVRFWRTNEWKRQAKAQFIEKRKAYEASPSVETIIEINKLLKQTLSSAKQDRQFLHAHGKSWEKALLSVKKRQQSVLNEAETKVLSQDIYSSKSCRLEGAMLDRIELWIKVLK